MAKLKGTRTEKNLLGAFAGESQARNRYTYFAGQAKKDGLVQISDIFLETADHHEGASACELCPACLHPQAHFELIGENW